MLTTVEMLCLYKNLYKLDNQLLKVKYAFNFETYINVGTLISQITYVSSHFKLCFAVARHNFK